MFARKRLQTLSWPFLVHTPGSEMDGLEFDPVSKTNTKNTNNIPTILINSKFKRRHFKRK